jgi:hypothetical protein
VSGVLPFAFNKRSFIFSKCPINSGFPGGITILKQNLVKP